MKPKHNGDCHLFRNPLARAFESKADGWTLVTNEGGYFELLVPAAVLTWEAITEEDIELEDLLDRLRDRFPQVAPETLVEDILALIEQLVALGFVRAAGSGPGGPALWPRPGPEDGAG